MCTSRILSSKVLHIALLFLFSSELWINRGIAASLPSPAQSVQDATSARHRRSSSITTGTLCLPSTPDELNTQFQSLKVVNRIQLVPIMYKDALINVGMSPYVSRILSNQTLARCIKGITIDEDLHRYPPYLLVTECDLEKEGCSDVRLKNKALAEDMFGVSVLKKVDDSCETATGKEKWAYHYLEMPQCVITSK